MAHGPQFIGRERELESIQRELERDRSSLMVVYGRRRVGKSTLLARATEESETVFYQATEVVGSMNLELLKEQISRYVDGSDPILEGLEHWEGVLSYVAELADRRSGLTLVLDEFPYICESVDALPSVVQKVFDRATADGIPLNLVLCGSQISFMEELLGEKNPLRGRPTLELELEALSYREAATFFPEWSADDQLAAYGVFGGMPYYLQLCDPGCSLRENIIDAILGPGAPLGNEAFNVLQAELSAPTRYATILQAIGSGCTTTGDILGRTRELSDARALGPYIRKLEALRLIRIIRSMDASPKARNRRYYLADPFLAFWYRFGLPNSSALAVGHAEEVFDHAIQPNFSTYMGEIFEWIGRQYVERYGSELFGVSAREVGKIWGADYDLDIAATLLDDTTVFGECKWWEAPVGLNILEELQADSAKTSYGKSSGETRYTIVSKAGFTPELKSAAAQSDSTVLISPAELLGTS